MTKVCYYCREYHAEVSGGCPREILGINPRTLMEDDPPVDGPIRQADVALIGNGLADWKDVKPRLLAFLDGVADRETALAAKSAERLAVLKDVEWAGTTEPEGYPFCLVCLLTASHGHRVDCRMATALKETT